MMNLKTILEYFLKIYEKLILKMDIIVLTLKYLATLYCFILLHYTKIQYLSLLYCWLASIKTVHIFIVLKYILPILNIG